MSHFVLGGPFILSQFTISRTGSQAAFLMFTFWTLRSSKTSRGKLRSGGYLLIETVGGYGGNYLELPKASELRRVLRRAFDITVYSERKVAPRGTDAVSVQLPAVKR